MLPAMWKGMAPVVLVASLAANIFFIFAAAGMWMQDEGDDRKKRPRSPSGWFERQLGDQPPEMVVETARSVFSRRAEELQGARENVWSSREEIADAIAVRPFSLEAYREAVTRSETLRLERRRAFNSIVEEVVSSLDDDGRAAMAAALKRRIAERRERRERRRQEQESTQ